MKRKSILQWMALILMTGVLACIRMALSIDLPWWIVIAPVALPLIAAVALLLIVYLTTDKNGNNIKP